MGTKFIVTELSLSGCFEIIPNNFIDKRGRFIKTMQSSVFKKYSFDFDIKEEFISISKRGVVRGMHFQTPPYELKKIVYCIKGNVFDVLVDLRKNSPSYKKTVSIDLDDSKMNMVFIPEGVAHGFQALSEEAILVYKTSCEYHAEADQGILWNSIDIKWPLETILISERDQKFPKLENYESPF